MSAATPNPYLKTKIMTAGPGELRQMLLDGAVRFAEQARTGLENKDYEAVYNGITRCQNILLELINALKPEENPELCNRLSGLYTFLYKQLMRASSQRDISIMDEVIQLLRYESETWSLAMEKLRNENTQAASNADTIGTAATSGQAVPTATPSESNGTAQSTGPYQVDPANLPRSGSLSVQG